MNNHKVILYEFTHHINCKLEYLKLLSFLKTNVKRNSFSPQSVCVCIYIYILMDHTQTQLLSMPSSVSGHVTIKLAKRDHRVR